MKHFNFTAPQAMHQWCFYGNTDPALDAENQVEADKCWFNTANDHLFVRNAGNTAWVQIG